MSKKQEKTFNYSLIDCKANIFENPEEEYHQHIIL